MMNLRVVMAAAVLIASYAMPAKAATITYDLSGDVASISGLDVGGSFYDVTFLTPGTFNSACSGCQLYANGQAIANAISAFLNSYSPSIPDITGSSGFAVPIGPAFNYAFAFHTFGNGSSTYANPTPIGGLSADTLLAATWASVSPSPVPLPAALPLFATVLAGGGLVAWRRRKRGGVTA